MSHYEKVVHEHAALYLMCGVYPNDKKDAKARDNWRQRMRKSYLFVDDKLYFKPSKSGMPFTKFWKNIQIFFFFG